MKHMIIDGISCEFENARNILEVAQRNGIEIPNLCYCENLSIYGGCRMEKPPESTFPLVYTVCGKIKRNAGFFHEEDVVPNLMTQFGIDETQAEFVAEIKLRNINREYILKRVAETDELEKEIADLEDVVSSRRRIRAIIIAELKDVIKKYPSPRRTGLVYDAAPGEAAAEDETEDYHGARRGDPFWQGVPQPHH